MRDGRDRKHRYLICGMWGTTNLSLSLIEEETDQCIDRRTGPGASRLSNDEFEATLFETASDWLDRYEVSQFVLGGMVGSTIGWWDVGYKACPASMEDIVSSLSTKMVRNYPVSIVPGLKCVNALGEPDIMRGEEVEIFSWVYGRDANFDEPELICIPGTHSKWARVENRKVTQFHTSVVGETFEVLSRNGVLVSGETSEVPADAGADFLEGVRRIKDRPEALLCLLMSVRARTVLSGQEDAAARNYLSGLLIGCDIALSLPLLDRSEENPICVIGSKQLATRYATALSVFDRSALPLNAATIGAQGLSEIGKRLELQ